MFRGERLLILTDKDLKPRASKLGHANVAISDFEEYDGWLRVLQVTSELVEFIDRRGGITRRRYLKDRYGIAGDRR